MYRKVLIAFVSVFFANISNTVQGLLAFLILMVSLLLQIIMNPYDHESLNKLETISIITAGTTIYCGLFFLTGSLEEGSNIFLFIIILMSNAIFVMYWGRHMARALILRIFEIIARKKVKVMDLDVSQLENTTEYRVHGRPASAASSISK